MSHHLLLWLCNTDLRNKFAKFGTLPCCGSLRNQCRIYRADNEHLFNKLVTLLYLLNFYLPYRIFTRFDRVLATFLLVSSHNFISRNVPEALYKLHKIPSTVNQLSPTPFSSSFACTPWYFIPSVCPVLHEEDCYFCKKA